MTVYEMVRKLGAGEFDNVSQKDIEWWVEFVTPMVSKKQFGKLYDHARALLICHKLKMAGLEDNTLGEMGKIKNGFSASSVSDGGSSISFASSGVGNLTTNAELGMTIYGMQYLQLLKMCVIPIHISGEEDFYARV